jgi:hypothetical protein
MSIPKLWAFCVVGAILLAWVLPCPAVQNVVATRALSPPTIDGVGDDAAWKGGAVTRTRDLIADIQIELRVRYDADKIYFLVQFPDPDESRLHKPWRWNADLEMYEAGREREDTCVLKWALQPETDNLSVFADRGYRADIWFWKAHRTDPSGYADDKYQILSTSKATKAKAVTSRGGRAMFLQRKGDAGSAAYAVRLQIEYAGEMLPQYRAMVPTGSRADIRAKGGWQHGIWTIEWSRALATANPDDVQFDLAKQYRFGVSRYEIAARELDPSLSQPLYGTGDVGELLTLSFAP